MMKLEETAKIIDLRVNENKTKTMIRSYLGKYIGRKLMLEAYTFE